MRDSVGALSLTNIVIVFILLFSGYLCISVNQTKAYNVKNEILGIIQKHNGFDDGTLLEIRDYMASVGYRSTGVCDPELDGFGYTQGSVKESRGNICVKCIKVTNNINDPYSQFPNAKYYKIKVFFSLDIPLLHNAFQFSQGGTTRTIYYPIEGNEGEYCP